MVKCIIYKLFIGRNDMKLHALKKYAKIFFYYISVVLLTMFSCFYYNLVNPFYVLDKKINYPCLEIFRNAIGVRVLCPTLL